ncbi:uncharacterized protein PAC_03950 [Phialocephala subalpina]|uniref:Heterokaryon incompatibility domain-containing protein n=1 Tax=Phialocephala subalpina TaxID=576137 RepID=A0A1L7WMR0_9HELO|nr:uncharacterized protein PAC_03950 [Phialocephala subalpina]
MAPYKYKPLKSKSSIRLLTNLSTTGDHIKCNLEDVDLDTEPKYDCLSYTWGDPLYQKYLTKKIPYDFPQPSGVIKIDGDDQELPIGKNLYDALIEFGKSPGGEGDLQRQESIWIDAVCINQEDKVTDEKKNQIMMMGRIYSQAQSVVVWLGPEMPDDPGLEITKTVLQRLAKIPHEKLETMVLSDLDNTDTYEMLGIDPVDSWEWACFGSFILRSWFARMWVVQETFFAKKFIVFCGSKILDWEEITRASRVLKETHLGKLLNERMEETIIEQEPSTHSTYIGNPISNQFIFIDLKKTAASLRLERLLAYSRYFGATMAEDRVFAVLNMWKPEWKRKPEDVKTAEFMMKNKEDPVEVYTKASIVAIRVPRAPDGEKRWYAAGELEFEPPEELYCAHLKVKGFRVDEIVEFAATDLELIDKHQMFTLLEILSQYLKSAKPSGTSTTDRFEAFWRTLIKDTFLGKPAGNEDPKARKAFHLIITFFVWSLDGELKGLRDALQNPLNTTKEEDTDFPELSKINSKTKILVDELSALDNSVIPSWENMHQIIKLGNECGYVPEDVAPDLENIMASFNAAYQCRRMFRTNNNYLGITAESIKKGDEVWVFAGAIVPMVVRFEKEKWRFVGEAYMHGIMNGEAVGKESTSIVLE